ncbi:hypothetical protein D3C76_1379840 [compost metagenome]
MRVQTTAGGGQQVQRHCALCLDVLLSGAVVDAPGQRRVARCQIAGTTGDGGVVGCRGPRVEPGIALEILGNQQRTAYLTLLITQQAAVGLLRESHLGHPGDHQRVHRPRDQGHQQNQAHGRTYIRGHDHLLGLRPGAKR